MSNLSLENLSLKKVDFFFFKRCTDIWEILTCVVACTCCFAWPLFEHQTFLFLQTLCLNCRRHCFSISVLMVRAGNAVTKAICSAWRMNATEEWTRPCLKNKPHATNPTSHQIRARSNPQFQQLCGSYKPLFSRLWCFNFLFVCLRSWWPYLWRYWTSAAVFENKKYKTW